MIKEIKVSVPIRGLFNLTDVVRSAKGNNYIMFPSPSGDYLILQQPLPADKQAELEAGFRPHQGII